MNLLATSKRNDYIVSFDPQSLIALDNMNLKQYNSDLQPILPFPSKLQAVI